MKRRAELQRARAGALFLAAMNATDEEEEPDVPDRVRWLSKRSGARVSMVSVAGSRSGSSGMGLLLVCLALLVSAVPPLSAWDEDLELLDLVEEIPQTFYQFLNVEQVRAEPGLVNSCHNERLLRRSQLIDPLEKVIDNQTRCYLIMCFLT